MEDTQQRGEVFTIETGADGGKLPILYDSLLSLPPSSVLVTAAHELRKNRSTTMPAKVLESSFLRKSDLAFVAHVIRNGKSARLLYQQAEQAELRKYLFLAELERIGRELGALEFPGSRDVASRMVQQSKTAFHSVGINMPLLRIEPLLVKTAGTRSTGSVTRDIEVLLYLGLTYQVHARTLEGSLLVEYYLTRERFDNVWVEFAGTRFRLSRFVDWYQEETNTKRQQQAWLSTLRFPSVTDEIKMTVREFVCQLCTLITQLHAHVTHCRQIGVKIPAYLEKKLAKISVGTEQECYNALEWLEKWSALVAEASPRLA